MSWVALAFALIATGAIVLLVREDWRAPFRQLRALPLEARPLQTVRAYGLLNTPEGRRIVLDHLRVYVFRDQFVAGDATATAHRCGEAACALRLFHMMNPATQEQLTSTLLEEETRNG